jgi:hypothetical protein
MKILPVSLCVALLLTSCSTWHESRARHAGRVEAARDIAAGDLRLRTYGLPIPGGVPTFETLLAEKLGVKVDLVGGCLVTPELVAKTAAYNAAVEAEIARRFGEGILKSLEKEAKRLDSERAALR